MRFGTVLISFAFVACGGSSSSAPTEAPINLTASGLSAPAVTVPSGGRVHFFNMDTASHQITSTSCPDLDTPVLAAGTDSLRPQLTGPLACSYNDALNSATSFDGSVTVNAPGGGGGAGY